MAKSLVALGGGGGPRLSKKPGALGNPKHLSLGNRRHDGAMFGATGPDADAGLAGDAAGGHGKERHLHLHAGLRAQAMEPGCGSQIPFWLVGEFTHFRTYFSGWIGMFTGGNKNFLTHGQLGKRFLELCMWRVLLFVLLLSWLGVCWCCCVGMCGCVRLPCLWGLLLPGVGASPRYHRCPFRLGLHL